MAVKMFSAKPTQVHAIQLLIHNDPDGDNAKEIADWCKGRAVWNYDSEKGERVVIVTGMNQEDIFRIEVNNWIIMDVEGIFYSMTDEEFKENFDTEKFDAPPTCEYCLADPRYTAMGDPQEKRCFVCGVRYSGPRRSKEYNVLLISGLVAKGGD